MTRIEVDLRAWRSLDLAERRDYAAVVDFSPHSTVFHSPEWIDALEDAFEAGTRCLIARRRGQAVGVFPFFTRPGPWPCLTNHSSLRDKDMVYGGPVAAGNGAEAGVVEILDALMDRFEAGPRTMSAVVLPSAEFPPGLLERRGYRASRHLTAVVDLARSDEEIWEGVHPKTRNMISKARRAGLRVREADEDDLLGLPAMIAAPYLRARREPPPARFLLAVVRNLAAAGHAHALVAAGAGPGDAPIAGAIFLRHRHRSYYWAGGALEEGYRSAASHLVQWEGIRSARESGCVEHDLVMVDPVGAPGIARFKLRFGARLVPLCTATRRRMLGRVLGRAWKLGRSSRSSSRSVPSRSGA